LVAVVTISFELIDLTAEASDQLRDVATSQHCGLRGVVMRGSRVGGSAVTWFEKKAVLTDMDPV